MAQKEYLNLQCIKDHEAIAVFQGDQTESENKDVCRHQRECSEDTDLDSIDKHVAFEDIVDAKQDMLMLEPLESVCDAEV